MIIIEDDVELMRQLIWMLKADYEIHEATGRDDAVRLLRTLEPDNVILDLHLPPNPETPEEGLCLLKLIKSLYPETNVVVISANASWNILEEARKNGANSFLTKPFTIDELIEKLNE